MESANQEKIIKSLHHFRELQGDNKDLRYCTLQGLQLDSELHTWQDWHIDNTVTFLGCRLSLKMEVELINRGAQVLRSPSGLPYQPFRTQLYTWQELMNGYSYQADRSRDLLI